MAGLVSLTEKQLRSEVRISYQKVWEFQRRGLVHLHAVVRLDAAKPPPSRPPQGFDAALLARALTMGMDRARLLFPPLPGRSGELITFGGASGTSVVELSISPEDAEKIASYLGKYALKAVASGLERRIRDGGEIEKLAVTPHLRTMVETAWVLGGVPMRRELGLRRWAHQLGHAGHVLSKSRYWSTTFAALRQERRSWRTANLRDDDRRPADGDTWRFSGIGYDSPQTAELARALAGLDRDWRRTRSRRLASRVEPAPSHSEPSDEFERTLPQQEGGAA
jgi:hypothetical protein